ncbi:MAG: hypothetical protein B7Z55_06115, partial [Planctomycetales bacterium 12-60-4]
MLSMAQSSQVFDVARWNLGKDLASRWVAEGQVTAVTCLTGTVDRVEAVFHEGSQDVAGAEPLVADPIYL